MCNLGWIGVAADYDMFRAGGAECGNMMPSMWGIKTDQKFRAKLGAIINYSDRTYVGMPENVTQLCSRCPPDASGPGVVHDRAMIH